MHNTKKVSNKYQEQATAVAMVDIYAMGDIYAIKEWYHILLNLIY